MVSWHYNSRHLLSTGLPTVLRDTLGMIGVLIAILAFSAVVLASVRLFFYLLERVAERGMDRREDRQG